MKKVNTAMGAVFGGEVAAPEAAGARQISSQKDMVSGLRGLGFTVRRG